jgi:hypothetical protein
MLKPQDVLTACKLFSAELARREWTYNMLAAELGLSAGEAHNSVDRCRASGLLLPAREVSRSNLRTLLVAAVPRIFYAEPKLGAVGLGVPTSVHAGVLREAFSRSTTVAVVWPCDDGTKKGECLEPIYRTVPHAARRDPVVYELMALADVMRIGRSEDRQRAADLVDARLFGKR